MMAMEFKRRIAAAEKHLAAADARLKPLIQKYSPCSIAPHDGHYGELVGSIVSQQLSTKAAATIWKRVLEVFNGQVPVPRQLLQADTEKLRACGVSYQKIGYMKDLAAHILDGRLDMAHVASLPNDELIEQLVAVKGIGEWSAHMFMIFSLGRLDILPVGDLGIKKGMMKLYGLSGLPDRQAIERIAGHNNWRPYHSVASWYVWKSLDNA